jgi:RNA polymerase sigma-70 factor, ECF subfamily
MNPIQIHTTSDAQLMVRVAQDDALAFEELYRRHSRQAFRVAVRMVRHSAAAEDVTQEAFLSLWRSAARYEPTRSSLKSWLLRMVHNRGIDHIRRMRNHSTQVDIEQVEEEQLQSSERTDAHVAARERSREILELLASIPIKQRQVVELAYYGELTHLEIATKLGLPLGTVKGRIRLAHLKLQRSLDSGTGELAALAG